MNRVALLSPLALLATAAPASTVLGNPVSSVVLTDVGQVTVDHVLAIECHTLTQTQIDVDDTLQELDSVQIDFDADVDYCELEVHLRWSPTSALVQVPVDGFDTLSIVQNASTVEIELEAASQTATLAP